MTTFNSNKYLYLDNASTSFPKPECIFKSMKEYGQNIGTNPGRSGNSLSKQGDEIITETRKLVCQVLGLSQDKFSSIVFTSNATSALNMTIKGLLKKGDHVIISSYDHNSIIRPIHKLSELGIITYDVWECDNKGNFDLDKLADLVKTNTKLITFNHASNVIGNLMPIAKGIAFAKEHNIFSLVDATQVAGAMELNYELMAPEIICFTGHKSLLGPSGTGGFYVSNPKLLETVFEGGTGLNSHSKYQPESMPEKFESGTLNYHGIAGLNASIKEILAEGINDIYTNEYRLLQNLTDSLLKIDRITLYGEVREIKMPIISFTIPKLFPNDLAYILDNEFNVVVRPGLQCAPLLHKALGTYSNGTCRVSLGKYTTQEDINKFVEILNQVIKNQV